MFHENFENFALRDRKFYAEFRGLRESCYGREILPPSILVSEFSKYCKSRLTVESTFRLKFHLFNNLKFKLIFIANNIPNISIRDDLE